MPVTKAQVRSGAYYDSVVLMQLQRSLFGNRNGNASVGQVQQLCIDHGASRIRAKRNAVKRRLVQQSRDGLAAV